MVVHRVAHCCTIPALGSFIIAILTEFHANVADTYENKGAVRSPFRVLWNYPDYSCQFNKVDLELSKFGFVVNAQHKFVGNEIATLYIPRVGLWPNFQDDDLDKPINGGIPQLANLTAHLDKIKKDITSLIREGSTGYGVLDQEIWRTLYDLNFGGFKIYKEIMERTLQEAQSVRPNVHWGYYLYPQTWWTANQTHAINDRMAWLYQASTGIYPSIYIKDASADPKVIEQRIRETLNEAIRVRAVHGHSKSPVVAYTMVQNGETFFDKNVLDYAVGQPAEMGIDGVVIWGSSGIFKPNPAAKCRAIKKYVHTILGPYVSQLLSRLTSCSASKCGGRGRCIRTDYAESTSHYFVNASHTRQTRDVVSKSTNNSPEENGSYQQSDNVSSREYLDGTNSKTNSTQHLAWLLGTTVRLSQTVNSSGDTYNRRRDLPLVYQDQTRSLINNTYISSFHFSPVDVTERMLISNISITAPQHDKLQTEVSTESTSHSELQNMMLSISTPIVNQAEFTEQAAFPKTGSKQQKTYSGSTENSSQGSQTIMSLADFSSNIVSTKSSSSATNIPLALGHTDRTYDQQLTPVVTDQSPSSLDGTIHCSEEDPLCISRHTFQGSRRTGSNGFTSSLPNSINLHMAKQTHTEKLTKTYNYQHNITDQADFTASQPPHLNPEQTKQNSIDFQKKLGNSTVIAPFKPPFPNSGSSPQISAEDGKKSVERFSEGISDKKDENSQNALNETASNILPLTDTYENYVCQCYDGWHGPFCEKSNIF